MSGYPGWNGPPNGNPGNSGPPGGPVGPPPPPMGGGYPGGPPPGGPAGPAGFGTGGYGPGAPGGYGSGGYGGPPGGFPGGPMGPPPGGNPKRGAIIAAIAGVVVVAIIAVVVVVFVLGGDDKKDRAEDGPTTAPVTTGAPSTGAPSRSATPSPSRSTASPTVAGPMALPITANNLPVLPPDRVPAATKRNVDNLTEALGTVFDNIRSNAYSNGIRLSLVLIAERRSITPSEYVKEFPITGAYTETPVTTTLPGTLRCMSGASYDCLWGDGENLIITSDLTSVDRAKTLIEGVYRGTAS